MTQAQVLKRPLSEAGELTRKSLGALLLGGVGALFSSLYRWERRIAERQHIAELDDRLLEDVGISRAESLRQAAKPFWVE